jgi:hypothetical protein
MYRPAPVRVLERVRATHECQAALNDRRRAAEAERLSRMARREIPRELEMAAESWGEEFALQVAKALLSRPRSKLLDASARLPMRWARQIIRLSRALVGYCALCLYRCSVHLRGDNLTAMMTVGVTIGLGLLCLLASLASGMNQPTSRQVPVQSPDAAAGAENARVDPLPPTPWPWEHGTQPRQ